MRTTTANLRCPWSQTRDKFLRTFHDQEWGKLHLQDDNYLYEMLVLQLFQSGLNWRVILHKRKNFRKAFKNFVPKQVAQMTDKELEQLQEDDRIIRNHLKINAARQNARAFLQLQKSGHAFSDYLHHFIPYPIIHHPQLIEDIPKTDPLAKKIALQMKADSFVFIGPIVIYSYLQSIGLINDHLEYCPYKYKY